MLNILLQQHIRSSFTATRVSVLDVNSTSYLLK